MMREWTADMSKPRRRFWLLTLLVMATVGIGIEATATVEADDAFDRHAMLQSIVDKVILPGQVAFIQASDRLAITAERFVTTPGSAALAALQTAWRDASDAWELIALFNMDLRQTALHNQIDKTPANIEFIDDILSGADELTESYVNGIGSTSRGLPALEFLIFSYEITADDILAEFADERRQQYVLALAQNIARKAREVHDYWLPEDRDYASRFVRADQEGGEIQGSINMLANKMFIRLETDLQMWLGEPAGFVLEAGAPDPALVESRRSGHSLAHITQHLKAMQSLFNGGTSDDALGFADYLDFLGAQYDDRPLSDAINGRFDAAQAAAAAIDQPLAVAIIDSPDAVESLYESMRQLLILLRADMKSHLSILITFSDLDGDQ